MEYHSAVKKNEITSFAGKWMELEINMLSEISQSSSVKQNIACFCSHAEYGPKMIIIAIIIGH
jgi:hypothetical protein